MCVFLCVSVHVCVWGGGGGGREVVMLAIHGYDVSEKDCLMVTSIIMWHSQVLFHLKWANSISYHYNYPMRACAARG